MVIDKIRNKYNDLSISKKIALFIFIFIIFIMISQIPNPSYNYINVCIQKGMVLINNETYMDDKLFICKGMFNQIIIYSFYQPTQLTINLSNKKFYK